MSPSSKSNRRERGTSEAPACSVLWTGEVLDAMETRGVAQSFSGGEEEQGRPGYMS